MINSNLAWGEWTQVALQNGWTGSLICRKNGMGLVQLSATLTVGTKDFGTVIGRLPTGYSNPLFTNVEIFMATGDLIGGLAVIADGNLIVYRPAVLSLNIGDVGYINQLYSI